MCMDQYSEKQDEQELRERIIGLGTVSHHKSYYPELKRRIADLERFRTLLNETGDAIFLFIARTRLCIDHNRAACILTGYSAEEILQMRFEDLISSDYKDILYRYEQSALKAGSGSIMRQEVLFQTADNQQIPTEITIKSVLLTDETFYVVVARDISERKKTEAELYQYRLHLEEMVAERNEELIATNQELISEVKHRINAEELLEKEKDLLEITLRSIGDAVISTDIQGNITYLNKAAERLTGVSLSPGSGLYLPDFFSITHNEKPLELGVLIHKAIASGRPVLADEAVGIFHQRSSKLISLIISPITQSAKTMGVVMIIRDITEHVRLTEEIQKHERLESLGVLAGGIAHDFNNVLTAILGNITLSLELMEGDSEAAERIREAEKATFRAKGLTQQLLTFSKGGAPIRECSRIEDLIKETAGFATSGSNVRIVYDFSDFLEMVNIDRGQISQVVQNLVINALQAMPNGGQIIITGQCEEIGSNQVTNLLPGKYVRISFTDEGQGISKDAIPHIFEPYFSTKETGNGLGLTSSMFIIKKHHGAIEVASEPGMGTVFTLWLPVCDQNYVLPATQSEKKAIQKYGTVLLMDDEEGILNVVSTLLRRAGWEVICTHDGDEAISAYTAALTEGRRIDAVIMDLVIPGGMGGKDAIKVIKSLNPEVFAIVSSGYSNDPVMAEPQTFGFSRVLPKPYKIKDLIAILQN